ncbi:radical SAM protein [Streptomyces apocyni]|uniref:radical SAM protein n=1 Tax=Streptomyces apocyni TaxID=2654677 RepID=UPI0012E9F6F2|nr:radical SAM protein [Streptomyces apocyni]
MTAIIDNPTNAPVERLSSLALEITGQCQNTCASHCYAKSGPHGSHGTMRREDWFALLDQAEGLGVCMVQYIGGEPTLHPHLPRLIDRALSLGLRVEVFSNLVHVRPSMWRTFERTGVSLATSYYSDNAAEHEQITGGRGSYARTKANIVEAIRRGIPLRASLVHVLDGQAVDGARAELRRLGVAGEIRLDRVRAIGNGDSVSVTLHDPAELCGRCGTDRAAISPDGVVTPCVMSRWLTAGSIQTQTLAEILNGPEWADRMAVIPRRSGGGCVPDSCTPREDSCQPSSGVVTACNPDQDGSDCAPAETEACNPKY